MKKIIVFIKKLFLTIIEFFKRLFSKKKPLTITPTEIKSLQVKLAPLSVSLTESADLQSVFETNPYKDFWALWNYLISTGYEIKIRKNTAGYIEEYYVEGHLLESETVIDEKYKKLTGMDRVIIKNRIPVVARIIYSFSPIVKDIVMNIPEIVGFYPEKMSFKVE